MVNALELKAQLIQKQSLERYLTCLLHPEFAAEMAGMSYRTSYQSAENLARREINMVQRFEVDFVAVNYLALRTNSAHLIKSLEAVETLDMSGYQFANDRKQQLNFEALQQIYQAVGQQTNILYGISGPLTLARYFLPLEIILKGMRKQPQLVHQLLEMTTQFIIKMVEVFGQHAFLNFMMYDPVASGSLLSPKQYEAFCLPYAQRISRVMRQISQLNFLHICGDTTRHLDLLIQTGFDVLSLDQKVEMGEALELVGDRVILMGNVDPVSILLQGQPQAVAERVQQLKTHPLATPNRLILGSGCGIPHDVPPMNIEQLLQQ